MRCKSLIHKAKLQVCLESHNTVRPSSVREGRASKAGITRPSCASRAPGMYPARASPDPAATSSATQQSTRALQRCPACTQHVPHRAMSEKRQMPRSSPRCHAEPCSAPTEHRASTRRAHPHSTRAPSEGPYPHVPAHPRRTRACTRRSPEGTAGVHGCTHGGTQVRGRSERGSHEPIKFQCYYVLAPSPLWIAPSLAGHQHITCQYPASRARTLRSTLAAH